MFSVIIPLYNKAPYIEKAIYSVLNQSFQDFEVILVDDGSTDGSWDKLQEITSKLQVECPEQYNKIVILQQKNQGVSVARNNGVNQAKYDYITFLDADDWWSVSFLEKMKELITQFPDGGIYGSSYYKVKNQINHEAKIGVDNGFDRGYFDYFKAYSRSLWMPLWTGAVVIPKNIFYEMNGFKSVLTLGEDFDLWLRIALKYKTILLNTPLAYYNQDVDMEHRGVVDDKIYKPEEFFIFNLAYLSNYEKDNPYIKSMLDRLRIYTLKRYRIYNVYPEFYKKEIKKVNFHHQSFKMWLFYFLIPTFLLKRFKKISNIVF